MTHTSTHFATRAATIPALALILAFAGCKSAPAPVDDASLNTAVLARFQADPGLSGQMVDLIVKDRVATLNGNVTSAAARELAANDAAQVAGVRTVINNLVISAPTAAPTAPEVVNTPPPAPVKPIPVKREREKITPRQQRAQALPPPPPPQAAPIERPEPVRAQVEPPSPPPAPRPAPPAFKTVRVPSGTELPVRITQILDSASTEAGSTFSGTLASDVVIDDVVAFPVGTKVSGRVEDAKDAGHFSGSSLLAISLTSISRRGETFPISTETFSKQGNGRGRNTAEKVGGGAAVGAILGGILGGGKGAAIGAASGGGLGAGVNGVTRGQQVQIPSESLVRFRLLSEVTVKAPLRGNGGDNTDLQHRDQ